MKANELMIGDWVKCGRRYMKVTQLAEDMDCDDIEPILLTPEILERNGFEYKEGETGMYGVEIAPYYLRDDIPFEVFCDGEPFAIWFKEPVDIKYVHQLQQVLRLCGINHEIIL